MFNFQPATALLALACASFCISLEARAADSGLIGGSGGQAFRVQCPSDRPFLRGFKVRAGLWIDAVTPICARHDGKGFLVDRQEIGAFGGIGGGPRIAICPSDGDYVESLTSRVGPNNYVHFIAVNCRKILNLALTTTACVDTGQGCRGFTAQCGRNEAAVGVYGRSGQYIDAIGLICGPKPQPQAAPAPTEAKAPHNPQAQADCESNGNEWNPQTGRCIKSLKKPKFIVLQNTAVYDAPDGTGDEIGELTKDTEIRAKCGDNNWCEFLFGPEARKAFVYSGPGHVSLRRL